MLETHLFILYVIVSQHAHSSKDQEHLLEISSEMVPGTRLG